MNRQAFFPAGLLVTLLNLLLMAALGYLLFLGIKALRRAGKKKQQDAAEPAAQTLGERLAYWRKQRHMSQELVAEKLGVSRQAVSKWESGKALPSTAHLMALARLLDVPAEKILKDE